LAEQASGNLKVPFGLREGRLFRPDDVSSGKACGCICPACEATLIANQGKQKRAYFSHFRTESCAGGYETAVHLMAKQVILDERRLRIPPLTIPFELIPIEDEPPIRTSVHYPERDVQLVEVEAERQQGRWRPDLTAFLKNGSLLHIEIRVTHGVDDEKAESLDNLVEINLSQLHTEIVYDEEAFVDEVLLNAERYWYRCSLYDDLKRTVDARQELQARAERMAREHAERKAAEEKRAYHAEMARMRDEARRRASNKLKSKDSFKSDALAHQKYKSQLLRLEARQSSYVIPPADGSKSVPVDGEWMFFVPRSAWQGFIMEQCLPKMPIDREFTAREILIEVLRQFPWPTEVAEIMKSRNKLSEADARKVPDPEKVVAGYLKVLAANAVLAFGNHSGVFKRFEGDRWSRRII